MKSGNPSETSTESTGALGSDTRLTSGSAEEDGVQRSAAQSINLHTVLDSISEGFALLAPAFTILDVNAETLRLESRSR